MGSTELLVSKLYSSKVNPEGASNFKKTSKCSKLSMYNTLHCLLT